MFLDSVRSLANLVSISPSFHILLVLFSIKWDRYQFWIVLTIGLLKNLQGRVSGTFALYCLQSQSWNWPLEFWKSQTTHFWFSDDPRVEMPGTMSKFCKCNCMLRQLTEVVFRAWWPLAFFQRSASLPLASPPFVKTYQKAWDLTNTIRFQPL